ncbi:MAG: LOG family protein [Crocosphaera sp.]
MNQPENRKSSQGVSFNDPEGTLKVVKQAVLELWEVINALTSLRPPKRERFRVTIFGSARIQSDSPIYQDVKWLASQLTKMQCDIVTGGGPGLMAAANEGSVAADPEDQTRSIGIRIDLESEQETNPFVEEVFSHRTFFSRLHQFVLISNAFVIMPGGIGTTLEALMVWQLLQVRHLQDIPLIMVGPMWQDLVTWANQYMIKGNTPLADPSDLKIPYCVNTVLEAIEIIAKAQNKWLLNN